MCDDGASGKRDAVAEELVAKVGAEVDQQRLSRTLVFDVNRESRPLDAALTGGRTGVAVTADGRRPGRVAGTQQRYPHRHVVPRDRPKKHCSMVPLEQLREPARRCRSVAAYTYAVPSSSAVRTNGLTPVSLRTDPPAVHAPKTTPCSVRPSRRAPRVPVRSLRRPPRGPAGSRSGVDAAVVASDSGPERDG